MPGITDSSPLTAGKVLRVMFALLLLALLAFGPAPAAAQDSQLSAGGSWVHVPSKSAGKGVNSTVRALAANGDYVYLGGHFTTSGDYETPLSYIIRYNIKTDEWEPLACGGLNGEVHSLAFDGTDLYVGGWFTNTGEYANSSNPRPECNIPMYNIARYDTLTDTWHPLSKRGVNGYVDAIAFLDNYLVVGGTFYQTADVSNNINMNYIGRYNLKTGEWSSFPNNGLSIGSASGSTLVDALTVHNNDLYVAGSFTQTGGENPIGGLNYIARFRDGSWSALPNQGLNGRVISLAFHGDDLYAGGFYTETADGSVKNLNGIARLSSGVWQPLANQGLRNPEGGRGIVLSILVNGDTLYLGGSIKSTFDGSITTLNGIASYDPLGQAWSAMPNSGISGIVYAMAIGEGELYAAGYFGATGDSAVTGLYNIARISSNMPPVANAGPNYRVRTGTPVMLDGSASSDPDGDSSQLTYQWKQIEGPAVTLSGSATSKPTLVTPVVDKTTRLLFQLVVTDAGGAASAPANVEVLVDPFRTFQPVLFR